MAKQTTHTKVNGKFGEIVYVKAKKAYTYSNVYLIIKVSLIVVQKMCSDQQQPLKSSLFTEVFPIFSGQNTGIEICEGVVVECMFVMSVFKISVNLTG
jgi:hypothetical protein